MHHDGADWPQNRRNRLICGVMSWHGSCIVYVMHTITHLIHSTTLDAVPVAAGMPARVSKGDVAWMLTSTLLVLMMAVPGVALFYGGLVRAKNVLSVLMQVLTVFSLALLLWTAYGYSLAFSGGGAIIGNLDEAFLHGVTPASWVAASPALPEYLYFSLDRKSTRLNSSHVAISYAVFCLKKKRQ